MANNKIEAVRGTVAMIDALGVRNLSIQESRDFIEKINEILDRVTDTGRIWQKTGTFVQGLQAPEITTFGDTIVLSWVGDEIGSYADQCAAYLILFLVSGLESGVLFRGAISHGDYIKNRNKIIGPAISDVATWYETTDWIGIIATPTLSVTITTYNEILMLDQSGVNKEAWVEYAVPLKGKEMKLWSIAWPFYYLLQDKQKAVSFYEDIAKYQIPPFTEDKYFNTIKYFEWYRKEVYPTLNLGKK